MKGVKVYEAKPWQVEAVRIGDAPWEDIAEWCGGFTIKDGRRYSAISVEGIWGGAGWFVVRHAHEEVFEALDPEDFERMYRLADNPSPDSKGEM